MERPVAFNPSACFTKALHSAGLIEPESVADVLAERINNDNIADIAGQLGITEQAVRSWLEATTEPAFARFEEVVAATGVELGRLCDASGRPPIETYRAQYVNDPNSSLPGLIRAWREAAGLTNQQAAQLTDMTEYEIARFQCGSRRPGRLQLQRLAQLLSVSLVEITDVAWPAGDDASAPMRSWARCFSRPSAVTLRSAREQTLLEVADIADRCGFSASRLKQFESGARVPDTDECVTLARVLGIDLLSLLLTVGTDASVASRLAAAVDATTGRRRGGGPAKLTRVKNRAGLSWEALHNASGVEMYKLIKTASGTRARALKAQECLAVADAAGQPAAPLLAAFGHHA